MALLGLRRLGQLPQRVRRCQTERSIGKLRETMRNLSILLFLFLGALPVRATTYYVDATAGSDSNNGISPGSPWKTIAKVNATPLNPGDSVLFKRDSIWREQLTNPSAGSAGNAITYADYGTGNKPSIRGSNTYNASANWTNESSNLWFASSIAADPGVFIHDGLLGTRKTAKGALDAQWDYWYDLADSRLYVYSIGNPTGIGTLLEIAIRPNFWNQPGKGFVNFNNLDLRHYTGTVWLSFASIAVNFTGVDISQTAQYAIQYNNGGQGTITGCTFTDWGVVNGQQYAVQVIGNGGTPSGPVDVTGSTFTINHFLNTSEIGAVVSDDNGWVRNITNNTAINNGNWPGGAFWLWRPQAGATSITYQGNSVYRVGSFGIGVQELEFHGAKLATNISYNYIQDSDQNDVLDTEALRVRDFSASSPVIVSYNVINRTKSGTNGHPGIYLYGAIGAKVYGNTIVGADQGMLLKTASMGNDIRNNISAFNRSFGIDLQDSSTIAFFSNNLFNSNAASNYNGVAPGSGDLTADPAFTNRANNLLTLLGTSPAINAGANLGSSFQSALLPGSAWPSSVVTGNQNASGTGWVVGAFIGGSPAVPPSPPTALTIMQIN